MIIGNGMLAKNFKRYENNPDIIIFASGVSNSKETDNINFDREKNLLINVLNNHIDQTLIYFSTCSIDDTSQKDSAYTKHKKEMESLIQVQSKNYHIFRLPQVVGKTSSPTLINFLMNSIQDETYFEIQKNATRNLIEVNDVFKISDQIIQQKLFLNQIINIASPFNISVLEIVNIIEQIIKKKAKYSLIEYGEKQDINIDNIKPLSINIFDEKYIENILMHWS